MYLYIHKDESIDNKQGTKLISKDRSEFSNHMVIKILQDYLAKKNIVVSEVELKALKILRDKKGKPYLQFPCVNESSLVNKQPVHYSLSHSGNWWGCIIADEPVGFDIERYRDKVNYLKIAKRYFTEMEFQYILQTGLDGFFKVWVRKEAYVKLLGSGLAKGLDSFSVISSMKLSPFVIPVKEADKQELPFCQIRECFIEKGLEAAYCSSSGNPIKEIVLF